MDYQIQAGECDEWVSHDISVISARDPICEAEHVIKEKYCRQFIHELYLGELWVFKWPESHQIDYHSYAGKELNSQLSPKKTLHKHGCYKEQYSSDDKEEGEEDSSCTLALVIV